MIRTAALAVVAGLLVASCSTSSSPQASRGSSASAGPSSAPSSSPVSVDAGSSRAERGATADARLAADGVVFGEPLVITVRTMAFLGRATGMNRLLRQADLSTDASRVVVAPNHDTLYAISPVDLRPGPLVLTAPASGDRYLSVQLLDAYMDSFAYVGTRATGGRAGRWAIVGPGWKGSLPAGVERIQAPTARIVVLGRVATPGGADLPAARAVLAQIGLAALAPSQAEAPVAVPPSGGSPQDPTSGGLRFYDELGDALAVDPPTTPAQRALVSRLARLGIGPGRHPSTEVHDPTVRAALTSGLTLAAARVAAASSGLARTVGGWRAITDVGTYGDDLLLRAAVARAAWGANVPAEAVYARAATDAAGTPLTGATTYRIHIPAGEVPPNRAFWSVTLYGPDHFFVPNPWHRWALGSLGGGPPTNPDGSIDLWVGAQPPAGHEVSWLPAPTGRYELLWRVCLPGATVQHGTYPWPAIVPAP